jgi:hypothetical protein
VACFIAASFQAQQIPFSYESESLDDYYKKTEYSESELD